MKLCLNVGSGQRRFESNYDLGMVWINIDNVSRPGHEPDLVCDGAHLGYDDACVDYFVLHHVLEHFGCNEGEGLVKEAHRVLRLGGSLLVFVPNMRALAIEWLNGKMDTQLFMTNVYGAYMGDEADRHKWGFDPDSLSEFLWSRAQWSGMGPFDWRTIPGMSAAQDWWVTAAELVK